MRGMKRSIQLFKGFLHEQEDPIGFYKLLAEYAVKEMSRYCQLTGDRSSISAACPAMWATPSSRLARRL